MATVTKLEPLGSILLPVSVAQMREAANAWRKADLTTAAAKSTHDRIDELIDEVERLRGLLADKDYIRTLADYQRGHLSYAGQLEAREKQPISRQG